MPVIEHYRNIFKKFSAALIGYCVIVILWGAYVRISGSGNGCGPHWPLCGGVWIPGDALLKTWIELFHRLKSGIFAVAVAAQFAASFALYERRHPVRLFSGAVLILTVFEALLGALLVLGSYVDTDSSPQRAAVMSMHLLNTLVLLAALTLTWEAACRKSPAALLPSRAAASVIGLFLLIALTGAWASLSTTLFPSPSLREGIVSDLSSAGHFLLRIRVFHPIAAVLFGSSVLVLFNRQRSGLEAEKGFMTLFIAQLAVGSATLLSLSPVPLKLLHLLFADLSWIWLVRSANIVRDTP